MNLSSPFASFLHTNHAPSSAEIDKIKLLLVDWQNNLSKLDTEIDCLQRKLDRLIVERDVVKSHIESHRTLISPLRRLPPDTLSEIFVHCLPVQGYPVRSVAEAPLLLTRICRGWREVAISAPCLWCALHVNIPDISRRQISVEQRLEGIKLWLDRSRSLPLSLSLTITGNYHPPNECASSHVSDVAALYISLCHRWREFQFDVPREVGDAFTHLKGHDVPLLEKLSISFRAVHTSSSWNMLRPTDTRVAYPLITAPNLHKICIFHPDQNFTFFPVSWRNLTELTLQRSNSEYSLTITDALSILAQAPLVRHCGLDIVFRTLAETRPHTYAQPRLQFLQTLSIHFQYPRPRARNQQLARQGGHTLTCLQDVFDNLLVPALVELSVAVPFDLHSTRPNVHALGALDHVPFLSLPLHQFNALAMKVPVTSDAMVECLRLMPVLRRLEIMIDNSPGLRDITPVPPEHYGFSDAHLALLSPVNNSGTLCPLLQELTLRGCNYVQDEALPQFMEFKLLPMEGLYVNTSDVNESAVKQLKSLEVTFSRWRTMSEDMIKARIASLKEKGMHVCLSYPRVPSFLEDLPRSGFSESIPIQVGSFDSSYYSRPGLQYDVFS